MKIFARTQTLKNLMRVIIEKAMKLITDVEYFIIKKK